MGCSDAVTSRALTESPRVLSVSAAAVVSAECASGVCLTGLSVYRQPREGRFKSAETFQTMRQKSNVEGT